MTIRNALSQQGWLLDETETGKWVVVKDERAEVRKALGTHRVGKLIGSKFYVVPAALHAPAVRMIDALGFPLERIPSTSGRGIEYPGFQSEGFSDATLFKFAELLRAEVERCIQK